MSWTPLEPSRSNGTKTNYKKPITLTVTAGKKQNRRVVVVIRPHLMESPPEFLKAGSRVTPLLGEGEQHAGYMRITPGGGHLVTEVGGSRRSGLGPSLQITVQEFPGIAPGGYRATPPPDDDYDHNEEWIEFKLPEWAVGHGSDPQPEPQASSAPEAALHEAAIAPETRTKTAASPAHHKPKAEAKKAA